MTLAVVTSACHLGRVLHAPLCAACVLEPVEVPAADPTPCACCGGRRVVSKLSVGAIPCPACRPPPREPCRYCSNTGTMRDGRPCEGIGCAARGGVR